MAHPQQVEFCKSVRDRYKRFFTGKFVLDIGSLDINGNNQQFFANCNYIGVDVAPGRNVDVVSKGHELGFPAETFDTIISTECFEHDQYYDATIKNIYHMLKEGGLFVFTCATTGRPEHGTRRTTPEDAPLLQSQPEWSDYYKNLSESDIREVIDIENSFSDFEFSTNQVSQDLYFFGFKKGAYVERDDYSFLLPGAPDSASYYMQLFVDAGEGFGESVSTKVPVKKDDEIQSFVFDLETFRTRKNIRLDPLNDVGVLEIGVLELVGEEGTIDLLPMMTANACVQDGHVLFYDDNDPQIYFDGMSEGMLEAGLRLKVSMAVSKFGKEALQECVKAKGRKLEQAEGELLAQNEELEKIYRSRGWRILRKLHALRGIFKTAKG